MKVILSFTLISMLCWPISASDLSSLVNAVDVFRGTGGKLTTEIKFDGKASSQGKAEFLKKSIQFDLKGIQLPISSRSIRLKDKVFKNIYLYNVDENTIRVRINSKKRNVNSFKDKLKVTLADGKVKIQILEDTALKIVKKKLNSKNKKKERLKLVEAKSKGMLSTPAKLVADSTNESSDIVAGVDKEELSESEIPLSFSETGDKTAAGEPQENYYKLVLALAAVLGLLFLMVAFLKKWKKISGVDTGTNSIKIISQHHLGPKKSLCVVRVAGESILIGVTDQQINLVKGLSLLDEEIPETVPNNFKTSLTKNTAKTTEQLAADVPDGFSLSNIDEVRDYISDQYMDN